MTSPPKPYLVICDFDGTITIEDVTDLIWNRHIAYDWRAHLLPSSEDGTLSPLGFLARGYADVHAGPDALLSAIRPSVDVHIRSGFADLVRHCRARAWPIEILSHGLPFYMRHILANEVACPPVRITAFDGEFRAGAWHVSLPTGVTLRPGDDFKASMVKEFAHAAPPGCTTVYIGDGRLDFPAARTCDRIFAIRDSALDRLCRDSAITATRIDDFHQVISALSP